MGQVISATQRRKTSLNAVKVTRHSRLHIPLHIDTSNTKPIPLLLDYHGWSGTANSHENNGHDFFKVTKEIKRKQPHIATSLRWPTKTPKEDSLSPLGLVWEMGEPTTSGEAGTVLELWDLSERSVHFLGAPTRSLELSTATTHVVLVTLTTLVIGLPATTTSYTQKP